MFRVDDFDKACIGLTVILLCLKLGGLIGWSWWIVTAPLWLPTALGVLLIVILFIWQGFWLLMRGRP